MCTQTRNLQKDSQFVPIILGSECRSGSDGIDHAATSSFIIIKTTHEKNCRKCVQLVPTSKNVGFEIQLGG